MRGMRYVEIPYVDKKVSKILYGTASRTFMKGGCVTISGANNEGARTWYEM